MQLEIGSIVEGKVTGITDFGAFVKLPNGETGMVHISEVALQFVNQIKDFLSEGQQVKVKVIGVLRNGKISLSIKQTQEALTPQQDGPKRPPFKTYGNQGGPKRDNGRVWQGPKKHFSDSQSSHPCTLR